MKYLTTLLAAITVVAATVVTSPMAYSAAFATAANTGMQSGSTVPQTDATGIAESAYKVAPILPGMIIPDTRVEDKNKQAVQTAELFAKKPTVLVVYRGGWCPYCNAQLNGLKKVEKAIEFLGFQIVAISPDSNKNIQEQQSREKIAYTLLADPKMDLAKNMGLAFFLDKKTEEMYRDRLGVPFIDVQGESRVALPVPAVYIIDQKGMVHFQYVNPNYDVRLSEELLYQAASETMKAINAESMK